MSFSNSDVDMLINKLKIFLGEESIYKDNRNCIYIASQSLCCFSQLFKEGSPVKCDFKDSFKTRPIHFINEFRKENKVRELDFRSNDDIRKVG